MANAALLQQLLEASAASRPDHPAVEEPPGSSITYRDLDVLSNRVRDRLIAIGVQPGDRVGIYLRKSIDAVAAIFGALKAGAAYVPVDPSAPAWRAAYILNDCAVRAIVVEARLLDAFATEIRQIGAMPATIELDGTGGGAPLSAALAQLERAQPAPVAQPADVDRDSLAYILYTSGSTGRPKGVMLTHDNALSFIDWCSGTFGPERADRFSSHAPFHFDLSVLDLFLSLKHGATLILIDAEAGREPVGLAALMAERRITVWYSAPSILSMLAQYGKMERHDYSALRIVFFAGEVFPVRHLRSFKALVPQPRYFNLYGPTETNVCTSYEIPTHVPPERTEPYPIGRVCSNLRGRAVDDSGQDVATESEGELCIAGGNVMQGYWNLPELTSRAFLVDASGARWYRTGDIVRLDPSGDYLFLGRRDRMVKRRGNRIELGEVESGLYRHAAIREAAVVALKDADAGVRLRAYVSFRDGRSATIVELKRFCAETLPAAMAPDEFRIQESLPKTSTDKIDYQRLMEAS